MIIPTIMVKREGGRGYHIINRSDFNPDLHEVHIIDPLDRDGDGKKGGSLPDPVAEAPPVAKPKPTPRRRRSKAK